MASNLKSYWSLMPWLIYRTEEPPSLIQVILTLDTASLGAGHPCQRQHWETSGRHGNSIAAFWHARPWVRVWGRGESIWRNTLPQEVGMASTLNERKLSQGARITKRSVRAWRGGRTASLNNAVPFNTDLEYAGPQMLQSARTLFLILTHNWFPPPDFPLNYILTLPHAMKSDVGFSTDGIMPAIKTCHTLKVWIREDQAVLNERRTGSLRGISLITFWATICCVCKLCVLL